jgi:hypothetical protein
MIMINAIDAGLLSEQAGTSSQILEVHERRRLLQTSAQKLECAIE